MPYAAGQAKFWALTTAVVVVTRDLSLLLHEWAHAATAWTFGLLSSPFDVVYHDWFFFRVTDKGDSLYPKLFASGHNLTAALIAGAGPLANLSLALTAIGCLELRWLWRRPVLRSLVFWFAANNLGQTYSYIPIRAFSATGDIATVNRALALPAWVLVIVVGAVVGAALAIFFVREFPRFTRSLRPARSEDWGLLTLTCVLIFAWYGAAAVHYYGYSDIRAVSFPLSLIAGVLVFRRSKTALQHGITAS